MSKNNPQHNAEKALAEKLKEAGLPMDITNIINRKYKFVVTDEDAILAGKIITLCFAKSKLLLTIDGGDQLEMLSDCKCVLRSDTGTWKGVLRLL